MKRFVPFVLQSIMWPFVRPILAIFLHYKVCGLENLRNIDKATAKRGIIFAANHTSELDPVFVTAAFPMFSRFLPMFYTSREKSFYVNSGWRKPLYGGILFKMLGAYPVVTGQSNYEISLATQIPMLEQGYSMCYFPEGRVHRDNSPRKIKGGVAYLAWRTGAVIVPVNISKGLGHLGFSGLFSGKRRATVTFGKPIYPEKLFKSNSPWLKEFKTSAQKVMDRVWELGDPEMAPAKSAAKIKTKKETEKTIEHLTGHKAPRPVYA